MNLRLKIVHGKPNGHVLTFPTGQFLFGRGPECDICPNSDLVSRQHCQLEVSDTSAKLRDLGSLNGTLVNGQRVIGEVGLNDGDSVQIGPLTLEVMVNPSEVSTIDAMLDESILNPATSDPDSAS